MMSLTHHNHFMFKHFVISMVLIASYSPFANAQSLQSARELYASGNWETAKEAYSDLFKSKDLNVKLESSLEISGILWEQGQYKKALKWTETTKELIVTTKRNALIARHLFTVGNIHASMGNFRHASSVLQKCQVSAKRYKDKTFEILCRISNRFVRQLQGKSIPSKARYLADLKKLKSSGNPTLIGTALTKAAALHDRVGRYGDAIQLLKLAQAQYKKSKSEPARARNKLRLVAVYQNAGQWNKAASELTALVSTFRNMNNRPATIRAYALAGRQAQHEGRKKDAIRFFSKAKANAANVGSPQIRAQVELGLCEYYVSEKQLKKASQHCQIASKNFGKLGMWGISARSEIKLGGVAQVQKDFLLAEKSYQRALVMLSKLKKIPGIKKDIAFQKTNLCQVMIELKRSNATVICSDATKSFSGLKKEKTVHLARAKASYLHASLLKSRTREKAFLNAAVFFEKGEDIPKTADALLHAAKMMPAKRAIPSLEKIISMLNAKNDILSRKTRIRTLTYLAEDQFELKQWSKALVALDALKKEAKLVKDWTSIAWAENARARGLLKSKKRNDAIQALAACILASKKAGDKPQEELCKKNKNILSK